MGCKKLTYQYAREDTVGNFLFFKKGGLEKSYAEVKKRVDYYPFGMAMVGRSFSSNQYRYGFNGMEKDEEVKGDGNSVNFKYRMHDPRIGRFFAVDPLAAKYPHNSTYAFSENRVIDGVELEGLEYVRFSYKNVHFTILKNVTFKVVRRASNETITNALMKKATVGKNNCSINLNFFGLVNNSIWNHYFVYPWVDSPQPLSYYTIEGQTIARGILAFGIPANNDRAYFAKIDGTWRAGIGNTPSNSSLGFGGGVPLFVDGQKYGSENIIKDKKLVQKQARGYEALNGVSDGKTVLAYSSSKDLWIIVSQQDNEEGMSLDVIRDALINLGYNNIVAFDGGSSATFIENNDIIVTPAEFKNNQVPTGLILSVPKQE